MKIITLEKESDGSKRERIYISADRWEAAMGVEFDSNINEIREYDGGLYTVRLSNGDEKEIYVYLKR